MVVQLQMVFQILLLLFSIFDAIFGQAINSSCQKASCGNVNDIPFPFGIGAGCYLDPWFEVVCNNSNSWASPSPRTDSYLSSVVTTLPQWCTCTYLIQIQLIILI
jgi:hypothetical protein